MNNKVILADNGNVRMEADTISKNGASSKCQKSRVNIFLTKTFGIIIMIGIFVSMTAFSFDGKYLNGTYIDIDDGHKFEFFKNKVTVNHRDGKSTTGTYELIVEHKNGNNSRGFIRFSKDGKKGEMQQYVLEGDRLTIDKYHVLIKIK